MQNDYENFPYVGTEAWENDMNMLILKYTGWDSLNQMCANCPTLRVSKSMKPAEQQAIRELRRAYEYKTGKMAYPENGGSINA